MTVLPKIVTECDGHEVLLFVQLRGRQARQVGDERDLAALSTL